MTYRPIFLRTLHKDHSILHVKDHKQMTKILRFEPENFARQALKQKSRTYRQFSLDYLSNDPNNLQPQQFISHLKQLKSIKCLKIDLASLLHVPPSFFHKFFDSLRYLKSLSVIHFEIKSMFFVLQHLNFQNLYKTLPILNTLSRIQVKLSIEVLGIDINDALGLIVLLENLMKLDRFPSIQLKFVSSADIVQILEVIDTLKTSKSLKKFSLSLEKCRLFPANRFHELFLPLKEIKSLKFSEILFKECAAPDLKELKTIVPALKEVGQNGDINLVFRDCIDIATRKERFFLTKSIQNINSPHKIQVKFIGSKGSKRWKYSCSDFFANIGYFCRRNGAHITFWLFVTVIFAFVISCLIIGILA